MIGWLKRKVKGFLGVGDFDPDWTVRPGETLKELRIERGASVALMAAACLMDQDYYLAVESGLMIIDPVTAAMLERGTGTSAEFWLALQENYNDDLAAGRAVYP